MYCEAVPAPPIAIVPLVVIGEPVTVNADGAVRATLVTVPPLDGEVLVIVKFG